MMWVFKEVADANGHGEFILRKLTQKDKQLAAARVDRQARL
jgi:hypothetical protein